jgi:CRP/FNR family cyclic AMP-dependent transcriptional regulator
MVLGKERTSMNRSIFEPVNESNRMANFYNVNTQSAKGESSSYSVMHALNVLRTEEPAFDKAIHIRRIARGKVVATSQDLAEKMYVLMSGKINLVCKNSEGRRLVITMLEPGAIFGEGALNQQSDPTVFAEAAEDVAIWMIPASEARSMTTQYPILGWGLLQTYGQRLLQVENNLEDVAYKKLPERLAALLLELGNNQEGIIKGVSHQALADHLGTYRETVSAILRDFKRQEIVELGYRRINILDLELLKETAGIWEW